MPRRILTIEGKTYNSLGEACAAYGRDRTTVRWRVSHGMSYEEAILAEPQLPAERTSKPVTFKGVTYSSIVEFCEKTGVPKTAPSSAAREGVSLEDYVEQNYFQCGERYLFSAAQVAKALGVPVANLYYFRRKNCWVTNSNLYEVYSWYTCSNLPGMNGVTIQVLDNKYDLYIEDLWLFFKMYGTMEGADFEAGKDFRSSGSNTISDLTDNFCRIAIYVVDGKEYFTLEEVCTAYKISMTTVRSRMATGMSIEEAVTTPRATSVMIDGVQYSSASAACRARGVNLNDYRANRSQGLSREEAILAGHVNWRKVNMDKHPGVRPVTVFGVNYPSLAAACLAHNQDPKRIQGRLSVGYSLEDALADNIASKQSKYTWRGEEYRGLGQVAKAMGVAHSTLRVHVLKGESLEEAYNALMQKDTVTVEGVEYPSLTAAANAYGISAGAVAARLRKGLTLEQALTMPLIKKGRAASKSVTVEGVTYESIKAAAEAYGLSRNAVSCRLSEGWDIERACLTPLDTRPGVSPVTVLGQTFPNKKAAYEHFGVPKHVVAQRLKEGWEIDKAYTTPAPKNSWEYEGQSYSSLHLCCDANKVSKARVVQKLREGATLAEAIDFVKANPPQRASKGTLRLLARLGVSYSAYTRAVKCCESREEALRLLYHTYADEGQVSFHGHVFENVTAGCEALDVSLDAVREAMCNNKSFETVVHEVYYVYGDRVCRNPTELSKVLRMSRAKLEELRARRKYNSHDEFIASIPKEWIGSAAAESVSLSISKANRNIASVTRIGDDLFLCECATCHRLVKLSAEEGMSFVHADDYCEAHKAMELEGLSVTLENIRDMMRVTKSWEVTVQRYRESTPSAVAFRARRGGDVADLRRIFDGYFLVHCKHCNRDVIVASNEVEAFKHDESKCKVNEWEGFVWKRATGRPKEAGVLASTVVREAKQNEKHD